MIILTIVLGVAFLALALRILYILIRDNEEFNVMKEFMDLFEIKSPSKEMMKKEDK